RRAHAHSHERDDDGGDGDNGDSPGVAPPRDHHGFRSVPPPVTFSLSELADDCLLTEREVAAIGRWAVSTVETWRRRGHPLKWVHVGQGHIRYRAGDLRQFLAGGLPRRITKKAPAPKQDAAPAQRRPRGRPRKPPAQHTKTAEIQDAAPAP